MISIIVFISVYGKQGASGVASTASTDIQSNHPLLMETSASSEASSSSGHQTKPFQLSLKDHITQELEKLQQKPEDMSEWLKAIAAPYDSTGEPIKLIHADLDGDQASDEWACVLYESSGDPQAGEFMQRKAYGAVISYKHSRFRLQTFDFPNVNFSRANVEAAEDLTGDGKPEIIWVSVNSGAHTSFSTYTISTWTANDQLDMLQGSAEMASVVKVEVKNGELRLTGGLIDSVGAGMWQRDFTDTYRVEQLALVMKDRVFADSPTPYHLLMDGLWSEELGHTERALKEFKAASEKKKASYQPYAFLFGGKLVEGGIDHDEEVEFERVIQNFALLRRSY
ncbi:hypothetical protein [Paenibacillus hexagrammi]|uniref:FG-GAP repeat protein n=1 Tax=Paenibacillus hexagrammi TaxID=2908839 RepID=A0ABY3SQ54_9BACL|nr:hypothetical protein [Paenibacillus sp. YPD9-1]UJF36071.1 hypothetical protein L0M14_13930 [Paenibacillus sp. YPD9-1]